MANKNVEQHLSIYVILLFNYINYTQKQCSAIKGRINENAFRNNVF